MYVCTCAPFTFSNFNPVSRRRKAVLMERVHHAYLVAVYNILYREVVKVEKVFPSRVDSE